MFSLHLGSVKILDYVAGYKTRSFSRGHPKVVQLIGFPSNLHTSRGTRKASEGLSVQGLLALKEDFRIQQAFV